MTDRRARVLVVDDDLELRGMLKEYLTREQFDVDLAYDGASALQRMAQHRPDIMLLDVSMPGVGGFELLKHIRSDSSSLPVLMLTARDDHIDRVLGLELGADDYLTKPFNARELLARIRAILRRAGSGTQAEAPEVLQVGLLTLETGLRRVRVSGELVALTDAEFRVLELLVRNAGRVVSRNEITHKALGRRLLGLDRSVDTHMNNLRRKIGQRIESSTPIIGVRGAGYMLGIAESLQGER